MLQAEPKGVAGRIVPGWVDTESPPALERVPEPQRHLWTSPHHSPSKRCQPLWSGSLQSSYLVALPLSSQAMVCPSSTVKLLALNQPWWEYLYYKNGQGQQTQTSPSWPQKNWFTTITLSDSQAFCTLEPSKHLQNSMDGCSRPWWCNWESTCPKHQEFYELPSGFNVQQFGSHWGKIQTSQCNVQSPCSSGPRWPLQPHLSPQACPPGWAVGGRASMIPGCGLTQGLQHPRRGPLCLPGRGEPTPSLPGQFRHPPPQQMGLSRPLSWLCSYHTITSRPLLPDGRGNL